MACWWGGRRPATTPSPRPRDEEHAFGATAYHTQVGADGKQITAIKEKVKIWTGEHGLLLF